MSGMSDGELKQIMKNMPFVPNERSFRDLRQESVLNGPKNNSTGPKFDIFSRIDGGLTGHT